MSANSENERRIRLERAITRALVRHLAKAGWYCRIVDDGDIEHEFTRPQDATPEAVLKLAHAVDEARLYFSRKVDGPAPVAHGVLIVYGNGEDIISDWNYFVTDGDGFNAAMDAFDPGKVRA